MGLVGTSGCGKSTLAKIVLGLEKINVGTIFYKGIDLKKCKRKDWQNIRKEIQMIFQDPQGSLNPKMKIGDAIVEPMKVHKILEPIKNVKKKP